MQYQSGKHIKMVLIFSVVAMLFWPPLAMHYCILCMAICNLKIK